MAGLGRLPGKTLPARSARRREVDALVVGSGPAGMAAATALAARGREVEVVEDDLRWGGSARILRGAGDRTWTGAMDAFEAAIAASRVALGLRTTAAGIYGDDVLLVRDGEGQAGPRIEVVQARTLVLAPGAHDAALAFEGNDVPGVLSARAGCRLIERGVAPGAKVLVASVGNSLAAAPSGAPMPPPIHGRSSWRARPSGSSGSSRVRAVTMATAGGEQRVSCDALLVDAASAPAYELCEQAGGELSHERRGFVVQTGAAGRLRGAVGMRTAVFVLGEATGRVALAPDALDGDARAMAEAAQPYAR